MIKSYETNAYLETQNLIYGALYGLDRIYKERALENYRSLSDDDVSALYDIVSKHYNNLKLAILGACKITIKPLLFSKPDKKIDIVKELFSKLHFYQSFLEAERFASLQIGYKKVEPFVDIRLTDAHIAVLQDIDLFASIKDYLTSLEASERRIFLKLFFAFVYRDINYYYMPLQNIIYDKADLISYKPQTLTRMVKKS